MDGASKDIQGSSELISQPVKTLQTVDDSEKVPVLPKNIPFGLSVSPREFCMLQDIYHNITCRPNNTVEHRK